MNLVHGLASCLNKHKKLSVVYKIYMYLCNAPSDNGCFTMSFEWDIERFLLEEDHNWLYTAYDITMVISKGMPWNAMPWIGKKYNFE